MPAWELISTWTEEERIEHAELISECLAREEFLDGIREKARIAEDELRHSLDHYHPG